MNKTVLSILVGAFLISGALYITNPKEEAENNNKETIEDENLGEKEEHEEEREEVGDEEVDEKKSEEKEEEKEEGEEVRIEENDAMEDIVGCLEEKGVVVYGLRTCPACTQLAEGFGGYDVIEPIYVECAEERDRCNEEKITGFVPEIQIKGEIHEGGRDPSSLARAVGCES